MTQEHAKRKIIKAIIYDNGLTDDGTCFSFILPYIYCFLFFIISIYIEHYHFSVLRDRTSPLPLSISPGNETRQSIVMMPSTWTFGLLTPISHQRYWPEASCAWVSIARTCVYPKQFAISLALSQSDTSVQGRSPKVFLSERASWT